MARRSNSPMSNRLPENRQGTRSFRAYAKACGMTSVQRHATQRQNKKAFKRAYGAGYCPANKQGRVLRALTRVYWEDVGAQCGAMYYGHQ